MKVKATLMLTLMPLAIGVALVSAAPAKRPPGRVAICHNGRDIRVPVAALKHHFAHGDCMGTCAMGCPEPAPVPWRDAALETTHVR